MKKLHLVAIVAALAMAPASARAACFSCVGAGGGSALTQTKSATFSTVTLGTPVITLTACHTGPTGRTATLRWGAATSATGYSIYRNGGTLGSKRYFSSALFYTDTIPDTELEPLSYTYYVESNTVGLAWTSPPSNSLTVTFTAVPSETCGDGEPNVSVTTTGP